MFANAAQALEANFTLLDVNEATSNYKILNTVAFRLFDKSFAKQKPFEKKLLNHCLETKPQLLLATGLVPPTQQVINKIKKMGICSVNYLTDDPFNPSRYAKWFLKSLASYDHLLSPRRANISELHALKGPKVHYVPFAFDPKVHFDEAVPDTHLSQYECDVLFYGGADADRFPYITALIEAGFKVHLYGNYWQRNPITKPHFRGMVTGQQLRWAVSAAKINLCLVRRANRDGHVMRTFELAAMGACILAEKTIEHIEIFGEEFDCAAYFDTESSLTAKAKILLANPELRNQMAYNVKRKIATQHNTYAARLEQIFQLTGARLAR